MTFHLKKATEHDHFHFLLYIFCVTILKNLWLSVLMGRIFCGKNYLCLYTAIFMSCMEVGKIFLSISISFLWEQRTAQWRYSHTINMAYIWAPRFFNHYKCRLMLCTSYWISVCHMSSVCWWKATHVVSAPHVKTNNFNLWEKNSFSSFLVVLWASCAVWQKWCLISKAGFQHE